MAISEKVKRNMANGSYIRKMFEDGIALKKIHGNDKVFDLSLGNPMVEPPAEFQRELKDLVEHPEPGLHLTMEDAGYAETREVMAYQVTADTGVKFTRDDVVVAYGAAGAVNIAFKTLCNPGDEIISFTPNYFEYIKYADNYGGIVKYVGSDENFNPDFAALEMAITPETKAVVINSPNNPTGKVYSAEILKQLTEVITRKSVQLNTRVYVISDDVYSHIYYGEGKCPRIATYYPHTLVVTSYSKDLALPGERIGYVAVHPECEDVRDIINGLIYANRVMGFVNAPAIMQKVICRLRNVSLSVADYRLKRDFLYDNLTQMGYSIVKPEGAFYIFPKSPIADDELFIKELKDLLVLTTPGFVFEAPGYFRISYCLDQKTIEGSLVGLQKALEKYK
jgi:aspartate aminotransferase